MIGKKFCPNCGSENVYMMAGGITGTWMCSNCGYSGSIFPEREIVGKELKLNEKRMSKKRGKNERIKR